MATVIRKATVKAPVKTATVAKPVVKATPSVNGFTVLKNIEIPAKKAFGKRGMFNDLFTTLEVGDCVEIAVDADKKIGSKMNSIYNAARKAGEHGASVVMRVHKPGDENGLGGVIRLWFNGFYEAGK